jgi:hypothetical protein
VVLRPTTLTVSAVTRSGKPSTAINSTSRTLRWDPRLGRAQSPHNECAGHRRRAMASNPSRRLVGVEPSRCAESTALDPPVQALPLRWPPGQGQGHQGQVQAAPWCPRAKWRDRGTLWPLPEPSDHQPWPLAVRRFSLFPAVVQAARAQSTAETSPTRGRGGDRGDDREV